MCSLYITYHSCEQSNYQIIKISFNVMNWYCHCNNGNYVQDVAVCAITICLYRSVMARGTLFYVKFRTQQNTKKPGLNSLHCREYNAVPTFVTELYFQGMCIFI